MRRHGVQRLGVVEVVAVLLRRGRGRDGVGGGFRPRGAVLPEPLPNRAHQFGVLGGTFHQDVARPVERGGHIGDLVGHERGRGLLGSDAGVGEQPVGQRFEPGLAGDLRLGAALGLVRQVDVLDARFGVGGHQRGLELVGQRALLGDRGQHGVAALIELAQIGEPFGE